MTTNIDKTTTVNLGILGTLIVMGWYLGSHSSSVTSSIDGMAKAVSKNTLAVEKIVEQMRHDGIAVASLQANVLALEKRIEALER